MVTFYVIWQYNPALRKDEIKGWERTEKQAKKAKTDWREKTRIEEVITDQETLSQIRQARISAIDHTIDNISKTLKKSKIDKENILLVKHELNVRKKLAERMLVAIDGYIFEEEIEFYLKAMEEDII